MSYVSTTSPLVLAVVGGGPRGISVLERLAVRLTAQAAEDPVPRPVRIHLVDAVELGAGRVWRTDQQDWFTMNTVVSQVTMYSGEPDGGPDRPGAGPSLGQWLRTEAFAGREAPLSPDDYASRVQYGRYLSHVYRTVVAGLPAHVEFVPVLGRVAAVREVPGSGYLLSLADAPHLIEADRVVLATGHPVNTPDRFEQRMLKFAARHPGVRYLCGDSAADLDLDEASVPAGSTVGIRGLGLSFYDVMLSLTVGRGGRFIDTTGGGVTYRPSGREPVIVAGSRSGLPIPARGRNQKAPSSSHRALFLTPQALTRARTARLSATGSDRLDFAVDVLPLLLHEVEHVYYVTHVRIARGESQSEKFAAAHTAALRSGADPGPLLAAWGLGGVPPLDLDALARPFADERFGGPEEFTSRLLGVMDRDLAAAALGNSDGPLKAALDVLRDIRNVVRQAVDYGGLLPDSFTEDFQRRFLPVNSLLSAGPPASRVAQLRALVEQGVVTVAGPGTSFDTDEDSGLFRVSSAQVAGSERLVRVLVDARIPTPDLLRDSSPLTRQLAAEGMVRTYADEGPGGMDVTRAPFHVVDAKGRAQEGLYALGIPTEHTRWFTQVGSSRPGVDTLFYRDADAIAGDMLRTPVAVGSVVEQDATVQLRSVA